VREKYCADFAKSRANWECKGTPGGARSPVNTGFSNYVQKMENVEGLKRQGLLV
jgi:hypothetical protein